MLVAALLTALRTIDFIGTAITKWISFPSVRSRTARRPGISVIIPERANPVMLRECIESVVKALHNIQEPVEIIVVVNAAPVLIYGDLIRRHPSIRWMFFHKPLWFNGAIRKGLKAAKYDWVYLLNSDMTVDPMALVELLPWRAPHVFAIASQIIFRNQAIRREETGWTRFRQLDSLPEIFDVLPEDDFVRGTLYAGGGASLFQKGLLRRFSAGTHIYNPFYWEDVEWGTIAWRCGFESLFCPRSIAHHHHRATNRLFFSESAIDWIFQRNRIHYELRNTLLTPDVRRTILDRVCKLETNACLEMLRPSALAMLLWARIKYWTYPYHKLPLQFTWHMRYMTPWSTAAAKPTLIVVTPYAIYPPSHGGAMRLQRLIAAVSEFFNVILLSDEAGNYHADALQYFKPLSSVHLVSGRQSDTGASRIQRIRSHSHPDLKIMLAMLIASRTPAIVQIEFTELAGLIDAKRRSTPWLLTQHEVWQSHQTEAAMSDDSFESHVVDKFDAVITCCEEDARLVNHPAVYVVPNGADIDSAPYIPSPQSGPILFIGPFRYLPNLHGIKAFLENVYPYLSESIPNLRLLVLGGHSATEAASRFQCFSQRGIEVMDFVEHVRPILDQCSLTINPLHGVRGSCLKVAESLIAGRVCISTNEGARGFSHLNSHALVTADSIAELEDPIRRFFCDVTYRRSRELPAPHILRECSWDASAQRLLSIYNKIIKQRAS